MTAVGAAVDVGSNSLHLLVAEVDDERHEVRPLVDSSVFLGLGERVSSTRHLGGAARAETVAALAGFTTTARGLGATFVTFVGTEPVRRAADAARLVAEVKAACGVPLFVLTHEEEAWLNLLGVTRGRPVAGDMAVVDSGGGSTEVVTISPDGRHEARAVRIGSGVLTAAFVHSDPPGLDEVRELRRAAAQAVGANLRAGQPGELVAVGGTASNLAKIAPGAAHDGRLTRDRLSAAVDEILATPAAVLAERYVLNPRRAPLLAAGAAIMEALIDHYRVDGLLVSEAGLREGTILVVTHDPLGWRDRLPRLIRGWD